MGSMLPYVAYMDPMGYGKSHFFMGKSTIQKIFRGFRVQYLILRRKHMRYSSIHEPLVV